MVRVDGKNSKQAARRNRDNACPGDAECAYCIACLYVEQPNAGFCCGQSIKNASAASTTPGTTGRCSDVVAERRYVLHQWRVGALFTDNPGKVPRR